MGSIRQKIKKRIEKYLELDVNGIRNNILEIFIKLKKTTIDKIHSIISKKYDVSHNVIASMVGYIHSKLGILRAHKESYKTPIEYSMKEEYLDIVKSALNKESYTAIGT